MRADQFADDVRNTWQTQTPVMTPLTSSLLRRAARRFDRKSRRGGLFDLVGFVALVLFFCVVACWGEVTLCRIGCALIAIGISYSAYHRIRGGWMDWLPSERATGCLSFYRAQLTRRRDLSQSFPRWGILPSAPGVVLASLGWIRADPQRWVDAVGPVLFWTGLQIALYCHNDAEVARAQREIDLLEGA